MPKVRRAVITAAGRGTRQYPASSAVPKEMFPLVDRDGICKPVMQLIAEEALSAGIEEICIVTQPGEEGQYRRYFHGIDEHQRGAFGGKEWALAQGEQLQAIGERLSFVAQDSPEGYGHAVYQARAFVGDEPFLLLLGDHVYLSRDSGGRTCAQQLLEAYEASGAAAMTAVQATPAELLHLFGTLRCELVDGELGTYRVEKIIEKPSQEYARDHLRTADLPAGQYLCHFGQHVFPAAIFEALEHHLTHDLRQAGEIQLTSSQEYLRAELLAPGTYGACTIAGRRLDTGVPAGYLESSLALGLNSTYRANLLAALDRLLAESSGESPTN